MRFSQLFCPTVKEVPKEAELISHQLMLRAGLIRKVASGIYTYLPLGYRVIRKFEQIVREEMDRVGAQEILMPSVIPAELWVQTGRWDKYGKELLRLTDRHEKEFCYGPTHEEVVAQLVAQHVSSYRQLPLTLYQIQTKFRDEIRPRFGLMRGREFGMKDAYSFHADEASLDETYRTMQTAYKAVFARCGLEAKMVAADSGAIGGSVSAEFMISSTTGEDTVIECDNCGYTANVEAAKTVGDSLEAPISVPAMSIVETPKMRTIHDISQFLKLPESQLIKSLLYMVDGDPVMVLTRGDHQANELKVKTALGAGQISLADDDAVERVAQSHAGFLGPVGINGSVRVIADHALMAGQGYVVGANKPDKHIENVVLGRDFSPESIGDFREAQEEDLCSGCNKGHYKITRGIEVGHIFKLGTDYSRSMGAYCLDASGARHLVTMGCYGIGIGRTVAAAIEQFHDEKGIVWPQALAPYSVSIIVTNTKDESLAEEGAQLYRLLTDHGIETILDDRKDSAGVKFKDADLIGFPVQVVVGRRFLSDKLLEVRVRRTGESTLVSSSEVVEVVESLVSNGR